MVRGINVAFCIDDSANDRTGRHVSQVTARTVVLIQINSITCRSKNVCRCHDAWMFYVPKTNREERRTDPERLVFAIRYLP